MCEASRMSHLRPRIGFRWFQYISVVLLAFPGMILCLRTGGR